MCKVALAYAAIPARPLVVEHQPAVALAWFDRMPEGAKRLAELRGKLQRTARRR